MCLPLTLYLTRRWNLISKKSRFGNNLKSCSQNYSARWGRGEQTLLGLFMEPKAAALCGLHPSWPSHYMFAWAGQADVPVNLSCCKAHGKGKRKFLVQDKALGYAGLYSCWFSHYPWTHEYALHIWIYHTNMLPTLIVLLPEHTSKPGSSATLLKSQTFYCLSRFKNRPDSFLYHISLPTVILGQHQCAKNQSDSSHALCTK